MGTEGGVRGKHTMVTPGLAMFSVMLMMRGVCVSAQSNWCGSHDDFSYGNQEDWGGDCHVQGQQSPLNFREVCPHPEFSAIELKNYDKVIKVNTVECNHSHSVKVVFELDDDKRPYIEGGQLEGKYILDHFHFHWGSNDCIGSEHKLLGCSFAGEIHLVHRHEKHESFTAALRDDDRSLAVLGVWMKPTDSGYSSAFKDIIPGESAKIKMREILPDNIDNFYRYLGSKTTPPCSLNVTWTVFRDPVLVPEELLHHLRDTRLHPNYRKIQCQGDRVVIFRGKIDEHFATCDDDCKCNGNGDDNGNGNCNDNGEDNDNGDCNDNGNGNGNGDNNGNDNGNGNGNDNGNGNGNGDDDKCNCKGYHRDFCDAED